MAFVQFSQVSLAFDKELLYKNMVAAEADWLYNLEEWNIFLWKYNCVLIRMSRMCDQYSTTHYNQNPS